MERTTVAALLIGLIVILGVACSGGGGGGDLTGPGPTPGPDPTPGPGPTPGPDPTPEVGVFESGDYALYVPATVSNIRGILLTLGGPDTRGFVSGRFAFGGSTPEVNAALAVLGQELRTMAADRGLAVLGKAQRADGRVNTIHATIEILATMSGHSELANAPLLVWGASAGGAPASGFAASNPERVIGLFLTRPVGAISMTTEVARGVPTYVVQGELDTVVPNAAVARVFEISRRAGALWALAVEPGVGHGSLTASQREITTHWMSTVLDLRLGESANAPLRAIEESSGWLGSVETGVAPWATYPGDRGAANWFPSAATAEEWRTYNVQTDGSR